MTAALSRALVEAETALRAYGLTGAQAFDALLHGLEHRLGAPASPSPEVRGIAEAIPLAAGTDLFGLAYERFFPDLFKGLRGQFFTPPPIARLLVDQAGIGAGDQVLDPTCGSGGLLIAAARHGARVRGIELDPRLARLTALNLRLAGFGAEVQCADFFAADPDPVDVLVANPPFSVPITDRARLDRFERGRGRARVPSDHLFVEAIEAWVRPGGRAALVLPFSIVANRSAAGLRERIDARWHRLATCALPEGVFRPFGGAAGRAVLLWLERRAPGARPRAGGRWAVLTDPGYDVRASQVRPTSPAEVDGLAAGEGWTVLPPGAWTAPAVARGTRRVGDLAAVRMARAVAGAPVVDLADVDRSLGEIVPRSGGGGPRIALRAADVLVARLRPNLGNVARVPERSPPLAGSPEWIPLTPVAHGPYLLHALRTPTWRGSLPIADGQTRPRTSAEAVLASAIPWPGEELAARIDALSAGWFAERAALRARLTGLQALVDRFAAGEIDEAALAAGLDALTSG